MDNLILFGIKYVDFDPVPTDDNYFSLMVGRAGQKVGDKIAHQYSDTIDETSLSRAFHLAKKADKR